MPVSKHGKNHKKRVSQYRKSILANKKKLKEQMMKEYMEKIQLQQEQKRQESGEMIINENIDVDLDVDLGVIDPTIEDATVIEENKDVEDKKYFYQ